MTHQEIERTKKKLISTLIPDLINDLYRDGLINDTDLNDKALLYGKIKLYLDKTSLDFQIIIDHRDTILKVAEQEYKNGHVDFATTLFATFIEHTLNRLIHLECERKKIDTKTSTEIIKSISINGKCSWLLRLLGLPEFKADYLKTIMKISDERNSYIHYKWKPESDTDKVPDPDAEAKKQKEKYLQIKKVLRYLRSYETRHEYEGNKIKIRKAALK